MFQQAIGSNDSVAKVRRFGCIGEKQHLAGVLVNLGMRAYSPALQLRRIANPPQHALLFQCHWIEPIQLATLVKAGQRRTVVHHNIGRSSITHKAASAKARALSELGRFGNSGP